MPAAQAAGIFFVDVYSKSDPKGIVHGEVRFSYHALNPSLRRTPSRNAATLLQPAINFGHLQIDRGPGLNLSALILQLLSCRLP